MKIGDFGGFEEEYIENSPMIKIRDGQGDIVMQASAKDKVIRTFETGATRDSDVNKFDYEGFLSPLVLERYGAYMHKHRKQSDGALRPSDNWQKGIPKEQYLKSTFRHFMDLWKLHRGYKTDAELEDTLCALMFNIMGYLFEVKK